jgi:peptidoglycan/LPS O-acetylase OafA/YrhL
MRSARLAMKRHAYGQRHHPGFLELATCSIAFATGTYFLIEKPTLGLKNRWAESKPAGLPKRVAPPAVAPAA